MMSFGRLFILSAFFVMRTFPLAGHCQMPCGIYHDDMVYDQIDQYVETMYKAIHELEESKFSTPWEKSQFVRWVMVKEKESDDAAKLLTTYFLQQKIKPDEQDTAKKLAVLHKLLFLTMQIKQHIDVRCVKNFQDNWIDFKLMFHNKDYECEMQKKEWLELEKIKKEREAADKKKDPSKDVETKKKEDTKKDVKPS